MAPLLATDDLIGRTRVSLIHILSHEVAHALQRLSPSWDSEIAKRASTASQIAHSTGDYKIYIEDYLLNVYERHAHATQAAAELMAHAGIEQSLHCAKAKRWLPDQFDHLWLSEHLKNWQNSHFSSANIDERVCLWKKARKKLLASMRQVLNKFEP